MLYSRYSGNFVLAIVVSFFSFSTLPFFSYSQTGETDAIFILRGNTRLPSGKGVEGVELELKKNGKSIQKLLTGKNGKYSLKLDISVLNKNNEYLLFVTQAGTVPKSISINTYISPEEYNSKTFPSYLFELEIKMIETKVKDIIVERPSGRIAWDNEQHAFAFDQTYAKIKEDDTEKILADKKKREEEERAKKKANEEAKLKAEAEAKLMAEQRTREDANKALQKNQEAARLGVKKKRMRDSLDSIAVANKGKNTLEVKEISKPVSPDNVDQNSFDGTGTYAINIAKRALKASQERSNREKAGNLSAKYETNNTLTSLLNMVDEFEKNNKSTVKSKTK